MPFRRIISALCLVAASTAQADEQVGPWNLTELYKAPAMRWVSQDQPVQSLLYVGEPYEGNPTEVFAFYASPSTLGEAKPGTKFPGVVLIHGGGGTAFAEWAWLWAKRGYAAIAMDLSGRRPPDPTYDPKTGAPTAYRADPSQKKRLPNGGPDHGSAEKFESIGGTVSDDWPYHAAASVIRSHSLLRSLPEVDAERTAVTGISWGGYTTCLVASLDHRFKAAVPVYGCGFLFEGESVQKPQIDQLGDRRAAWIKEYDPSSLLSRCRIPILFVNGTHDIHYPLDSYRKTFDGVPGNRKQMRIQVKMPHGHQPGWAPQEIGLFIDSYCRGGTPLPTASDPHVRGDVVAVSYTSAVPITKAELHYTTDSGIRSKRAWQTYPADVGKDEVTVPRPPAAANTWFVALTDERGAMVSTPVQLQEASKQTAQQP